MVGNTGVGLFLEFFFFQAEDGIRDYKVTGVQTCALPISQVGERIPAAGTALHRGVPGLELEEPPHGGIVTEDRGRVDVAARDLRVRRQDPLGALERPVPDGGLDERRPWIVHRFAGASGPRLRGGPIRRASRRWEIATHVLPPSVERSAAQEKRSGRMS